MTVMGNPDRFFPAGDDRFRVEVLDDDVLLLDVQTNIVHRVPGAEVDRLLSGSVTWATGHLPPGGARAIRRAVDSGSVARRSLLVGGGALVASGILSTGLPFAAAAASLFPAPFDGTTYTEGWNGQTEGSRPGDDRLFGPGTEFWIQGPASGDFPGAFDGTTKSAQVILHATSGTARASDGSDATPLGHGAYIVATISGIPTGGPGFYFSIRGGGDGSVGAGDGGNAVGAMLWAGGGDPDWLVVAGAGGGDGAAPDLETPGAAGGRHSGAGSGANPGQGASGSSGGARGTANPVGSTPPTNVDSRNGYNATTDANLGSGTELGYMPGRGGYPGGGGGGAGWAGGGGGGTSSGGGGGSSFFKTTGSGALVSAYSIYTVPRAYSSDGSTVRVELYTS